MDLQKGGKNNWISCRVIENEMITSLYPSLLLLAHLKKQEGRGRGREREGEREKERKKERKKERERENQRGFMKKSKM